MFLAAHGQPSDAEVFTFFLCEKLGKTLGDLDAMPAAEYVGWVSYYKVKQQQEDLASKVAARG